MFRHGVCELEELTVTEEMARAVDMRGSSMGSFIPRRSDCECEAS